MLEIEPLRRTPPGRPSPPDPFWISLQKKVAAGFERSSPSWAQSGVTSAKASFLLALSLSAAGIAPAAAAVAAPDPDAPPAAEAVAPWSVSLEARGLRVDEAALRSAVERELARAELPAATRPVQVEVAVDAGGSLRVLYKNALGAELRRSVAAPTRGEEVPEASALLVGNLARDEASGLLAQLQQQSAAASQSDAPAAAPAQATLAPDRSKTVPDAPPELSLDSVNLTLFHPLSLRGDSEHRRLMLEFGMFYSRTGAITGLSLTFSGVSRIDGALQGMQLGALGYWHGGTGSGLRVGGLFGLSQERFTGLSVAGTANLEGEHVGLEVAGAINIARGQTTGAQLSGLLGYAGGVQGVQLAGAALISNGDVDGAQISGGANLSTGAVDGFQLAGAANLSGPVEGFQVSGAANLSGPVDGFQLAGAANLSGGPVEGAQIAGIGNVAGDVTGLQLSLLNVGGSIDGAQIGIVNVAEDVSGLQLGLVNVARSVRGQSIGIVPFNRQGGVKIATWYNSSQPFNVGLRFHAGFLYMMPTFAYDPGSAALVSDPGRARYAPGTSLGLRIPLDRAYVDVDANYSQR
ncbi:MAG: hypothetical protein RL033_6637, partial [Pseudomonadota bacterium]